MENENLVLKVDKLSEMLVAQDNEIRRLRSEVDKLSQDNIHILVDIQQITLSLNKLESLIKHLHKIDDELYKLYIENS